ncbi:chromate transporter [Acidisphaera sp. L21]|uniref:chromate transporter n=1 Tax=Acidisphaera sp. L21 TaxID=1641851 RepID=UPI00131BEE78|nr:chromate transporter [Acidisphaera sp. L21]
MPEAPTVPTPAPELSAPGLASLFVGFFGIGIVGFGGVLPWARRMMVDQRRWVSSAEFNDMLALCQFLPGPNVINLSIAMGARARGVVGSLVCVLGLLVAPMMIVIGLGGLYQRYGGIPIVAHGFAGLAAAASGLVVAMAVKIASPLQRHWAGIVIALVAFAAIALLRLPLLPTMVIMAPLSILICRRFPA